MLSPKELQCANLGCVAALALVALWVFTTSPFAGLAASGTTGELTAPARSAISIEEINAAVLAAVEKATAGKHVLGADQLKAIAKAVQSEAAPTPCPKTECPAAGAAPECPTCKAADCPVTAALECPTASCPPAAAGSGVVANPNCLTNAPGCNGTFGYNAPLQRGVLPKVTAAQGDACAASWPAEAGNTKYPAFRRHNKRSSKNEDLIVFKKFFQGEKYISNGGVYLELGAFDGISESNTHFFEHCLHWTGILVEGHPKSYEMLTADDRRPAAHKMHFLPSCPGLSTQSLSGRHDTGSAVSKYDKRFPPMYTVHCAPLSTYLQTLGLTTVDFFSLDVEGSEYDVMSNIDFSVVRFGVIIAENDKVDLVKLRALMAKNNYKLMEQFVPASDCYVHNDFPFTK